MATRTWAGGTNVWTSSIAWSDSVAPLLDDTAVVSSGIVEFDPGETLDAVTIEIGSQSAAAPATLLLDDALLGARTTLDSTAAGARTLLVDFGTSGFSGVIDASASGGSFNIATYANGATAGPLTLLYGAEITDSGGDSMLLDGTLINHSTVIVGNDGDFVNTGTISQAAGAFEVDAGGTLNGGLFQLGLDSSLYFDAGAAASSEAVDFTDAGGRLLIADPANFTGVISNFATGDLIDLTSIVANGASYDPASELLTVTENGSVVATLTLDAPAGTGFVTASDTADGTLIEFSGSQPRVAYTIDGPDQAMGADVVRATMTTANGTPITGAGVRIGIISDSFDNGTVDVANAAAAQGLLPANADGSSAVTVLSDIADGNDEGLAMAELVHQVAPGASIDFADAGGDVPSFADAVTALQQAGCNIIVDDVNMLQLSLFPGDNSLLTDAVDTAVAGGVSYFTGAGNDASDGYEASFAPVSTTLYDGTQTTAQMFDNGTPYQTITLTGGVTATFDLQYGSVAPGELNAELFDMSDNLVASSSPMKDVYPDAATAGAILSFTPATTGQYQLAIYGSLPAGDTFKYIMVGTIAGQDGTSFPGTIDDPAADAGSVFGNALNPEVNAVGAIDFADLPPFSNGIAVPDSYSSTGDPGSGKPDLLAPVDAGTTVFPTFAGSSAAGPEAAAVAALMLQANPSLTPADITAELEATATSIGQPASVQGAGVVNAVAAVQAVLGETVTACFAAGTRIATARGPVAVESLLVGDSAITESGALRPIRWLGHRRLDCRRHPRPDDVRPVRIVAHAFGLGRPRRDIRLSPDHAVWVDGVLIPVRYLLNGATLRQEAVAAITYWHVELDCHDVLLAEGLPAESYLDTGNRAAFSNGGAVTMAHPEFARAVWRHDACAPLVRQGAARDRVYRQTLAQAFSLGWRAIDAGDGASTWVAPDTRVRRHRAG